MNKRLKILIRTIKEVFEFDFLDKISKKSNFIRRKSKITADAFLTFNTFSSEDLCDKSLSTLCSRLAAQYNILVSPQALNERYNEYSVKFMQDIFNELMIRQNKILSNKSKISNFNRILINDSTSYGLPVEFASEFKGSGGARSKSAIKIQLQYDLLSGSFTCCDIMDGTGSDSGYVNVMDKYTERGDLRLADLGYYKNDYLKKIVDKKAFFISKLKSDAVVYKKNENPTFKKNGAVYKSTEYIKIDIFQLVQPLADGETIELKDIYIGSKKELKSRLIITKLSEESKRKRQIKHLKSVKAGRSTLNDRSIFWNEINVYITNVPENIIDTMDVHSFYSLRWQIEIMFKIWKSIFNINNVKKVKIERFKCFLYGRLISLLFSSIIVFTAKDIIYEEDCKEISELKSFYEVTEFFHLLRVEIFNSEIAIIKLISKIINVLRKLAVKSKKKNKKTVNEIINSYIKSVSKMEYMAI